MTATDAPHGKLFVIAAPSGAGKTSLVHALLERVPNLRFSTSYTTRPRRQAEVDGQDYFFVDADEFRRMIDNDEFLEHAQVFDNYYGTSASHVAALLAEGFSVLLEIDWQGAQQIRARAPEAISIFIVPPSVAELGRRLRGRRTDSDAVIARRLHDSVSDMSHWDEFDYVVVNDDFDLALGDLMAVVNGQGDAHSTAAPPVRARIRRILSEPA